MNIAVIKDNICVNTLAFDDLATAQSFLENGAIDGDSVLELPEGYGIGDMYTEGEWAKAPVDEPQETPEQEIARLKSELANTDYKIIKQAEAELAGADLPYTAEEMTQIHTERQALRDQIGELEGGVSS
ncbi:MAG: hypothetical protein LBL34_04975 [Clostridiales bacterium]|jgi:hypothetical protein|nr:hypothetical protein [Clostridiales bacterium]